MHYTVLYDISNQGYQNWSQLVIAALYIAFPVLALWIQRRIGWRFPTIVKFPLAVLIFLGVSICIMVPFGYKYYLNVRSAVDRSAFEIIEGTVTNLHQPIRYSSTIIGGALEPASFSVNGITFRCWDQSHQRGHDFFQRSDLLHNGLQVRIYYVNSNSHENIITHLEVSP